MTQRSTRRPRPFDEFVELEFGNVVALALGVLRDEDDAVDVAQETMLRTFERWGQVSALERPGAWSRRVALNLVNDRLRGRSRRQRLLDRLRQRRPMADVAVATGTAGVWDEEFWGHVAELPRPQRDAVALHYVLDLAVVDIAAIVERPEGTVKSDLARARTRLRALMEPDVGTDVVDREAIT